jgi:hypothetical protein
MSQPQTSPFLAQLESMATQLRAALVTMKAPEKVLKSGDQFLADLREWKGGSNG